MKYLLFMLIFISSVFANIGKVSAVVGNANIERNNKTLSIKIGSVIEEKDIIRTQANAKVQLIFTDNTIITVGKNSALNINDYLYDTNNPQNSKANFNFFKGAFKTITGQIGKINKKKFKLKTSSASIGIRGTIVLGTQDIIACTSGGITVESGGKTINVNVNEITTVAQGQAPTPAQKITPAKLKELEAALGGGSGESSDESSSEEGSSAEASVVEETLDTKGKLHPVLKIIEEALQNINQHVDNIKIQEAAVDQSALTVINTIGDIQSALYELDMAKDNAEDAKSDAAAASYDSHTEYAKAVTNNSSYTDVEVAYAAYAAEMSVESANNNAAEAANQAIEAEKIYNDLEANLGTKIGKINTELSKATTAKNEAQSGYNNAVLEKNIILTALNSLGSGADANVRNTAQNSLVTAQKKLDEAQLLLDEAEAKWQAAYDEYGEIGPFDEDSILSDALTTKNAAQTAKTQAQTEADNTITNVELQAAIDKAKIASENVKTVMTSNTLKSLTTDGSTVDVSGKTFVLSGVRTNSTVLSQDINGYTEHTQLGVFKETYENEDFLYKIQADNLHEFFVGYTQGSNNNKALFVYGEDFTGTLDNTKVYMYKNFKTFDKTYSTKGQLKTEDVYYYYNAKHKSMTAVSKDFFSEGAKQFVVGYDKTVQTIENDFEINGTTLSDVSSEDKERDIEFKGSRAQGMVQTVTTSSEVTEMNASFLHEKKDKDETTVGKTLEGKTEFLVYNPATQSVEMRTENMEIDITGTTILNINASIKNSSASTLVNFDSDVSSDLEAYYINSDIFGVKNNDGFLMAVPDGAIVGGEFVMFDTYDNPLTTQDDASWGFWTGKEIFDDISISDGSVGHQSVWVAGVKTAQGVVQTMMDNSTAQTLEFQGKVLGHVNGEAILGDDTNKVDIAFNVGGGTNTMSGTMQFKSPKSHHFKLDMNFDTVTSSGFSGDFKSQGSVNQVDNSFNEFSGNYYGDGDIKSVGGNFKVKEQGDTATGVFKALKK